MRNMRSIGIDLQPWVTKGLLHFHANRPSFAGLETHLAMKHKVIDEFKPQVVILDPLNSFVIGDNEIAVQSMLMRLLDFLKTNQITGLFTNLTSSASAFERTEIGISSLIDTWLLLRAIDNGDERNRGLIILKSRGMAHSNQIREFVFTDHGVELRDVNAGASGVLTGSARLAQEAQEQAGELARKQETERRQLELERKRKSLEAQIAAMRAEFEAQAAETLRIVEQEQGGERRTKSGERRTESGERRAESGERRAENGVLGEAQLAQERVDMGLSRQVDATVNPQERDPQ